MDKDSETSIWNFRYGLEKEKVKSETFEYLTEYGSLKSIALIFMINLADGERKGLHCHMILEFRNPVTITSLRNSSLKLENLWTIKIWCSVETLKQVNHQEVAVIVIWHIRRDQAMMERKTRCEVQVLVAEYETGQAV